MRLRTKYLLFVGTLHAVAIYLSFHIFEKDKVLFLISEVFILISILISWQLYNQMIRPIKLLVQSAEGMKERDFNVKLVESGTYELDQLIAVYNQMIEALREERTQQERQHFFLDKLILSSPVGIIILDHDNRIQQVNPVANTILQSLPLEGWLLTDIGHPIFEEIIGMLANKVKSITFNSGSERYKIELSSFMDRGFPRNFIIIQELTHELLEAEKQAYGKVIRMMAHEVNNTIGPVNSILQSALGIYAAKDEKSSLTNALQVAIDRNYNLNVFMRNLADVVRLPEPDKKETDLHELLDSVISLFKETAAKQNIVFEFIPAFVPKKIVADRLQMEQVLINIVKNAIEAIDRSTDGRITFTGDSLGILCIKDNGRGISEATEPYLFSPFFSTKADGQGIGLTLIKDILLKHNFQFRLAADNDGQTAFRIFF